MRIRIIGAIVAVLLAAVGAYVLVLYVQGADQRAAGGAALYDVYIVDTPIPEGTTGESIGDYVSVQQYPARTIQPHAVTDLTTLQGLVLDTPLYPGDQLIADRFVDPAQLAARGEVPVPEGLQEVTVSLPVSQVVGGAVVPGDKVGILLTDKPTGGKATTQFLLQEVLVTRVIPGDGFNTAAPKTGATGSVTSMLVTFALSTHNAERVVWSASQGEVWLTLQNDATQTGGSRPVTEDDVIG